MRLEKPISTGTSLIMLMFYQEAKLLRPAFYQPNTGKIGVVGTRDCVVFDEIANTDFIDTKSFVSIMQAYMQDAKFSREKRDTGLWEPGVRGEFDVQGNLPHEKYYHLFEPLPDFPGTAFLDRIHGYLPGWRYQS